MKIQHIKVQPPKSDFEIAIREKRASVKPFSFNFGQILNYQGKPKK